MEIATLLEKRNRTDRTPPEAADLPSNEQFARWVLSGPFTTALAGLCIFLFLAWLPAYLAWPWWSDQDVFATLAHSWECGRLPYRDLPSTNFPGTIYLFWLLGRVFGWDCTVPFFGLDAIFLLALGAALLHWSRCRFESFLPGLVGFGAMLSYYLGLDYTQVAQPRLARSRTRDHGIVAAQCPTGLGEPVFRRNGLRALAFTIRPQVVLFFPAVLMALASGLSGGKQRLVAVGGWLALFGAFTGLLFLPLVVAGIWGDFLHNLAVVSPGGGYNRAVPPARLRRCSSRPLPRASSSGRPALPFCCLVGPSRRCGAPRRSGWWARSSSSSTSPPAPSLTTT